MSSVTSNLTPAEIVQWLDKHVIGQNDAKRSVAIALRNRYRRRNVPEPMRSEIYPSNIIMIGATGIGKTEIARRLSTLVGAPFVKVEASKYTETGYVGRDVEGMVRDLVRQAVRQAADSARVKKKDTAGIRAYKTLARALSKGMSEPVSEEDLIKQITEGKHDKSEVELHLSDETHHMEIIPFMPGSGMDSEVGEGIRKTFEKMMGARKKKVKTTVGEAKRRLIDDELRLLVERENYVEEGLRLAQEEGIIFIDEIDKIIGSEGGSAGPDVSRLGVQRELLPLVEGCTVHTRHGVVKTDHILYIAAGAFHGSSPSDLIPELQGRFPLRVSLHRLSEDDLYLILTEPENCLLRQYRELLKADGVNLVLTEEAAREVSRVACILNSDSEDIGARRLRPVLSFLLDDLLFGAPDMVRGHARIDLKTAKKRLSMLMVNIDELDYIL